MNNTIETFCEGLISAVRTDKFNNRTADKFLQDNALFAQNNLAPIVVHLRERSTLSQKEIYTSIIYFAEFIRADDWSKMHNFKSTFTNITNEMKFFSEFMSDWRTLADNGIPFEEWQDLCQRGLNLLVAFLKSPNRRQRNFLLDNEYDVFNTDFTTRCHKLRERYPELNNNNYT